MEKEVKNVTLGLINIKIPFNVLSPFSTCFLESPLFWTFAIQIDFQSATMLEGT